MSTENKTPTQTSPQFDVALSFAGEDRDYVEAVAAALQGKGARVFYDRYEEVELWGKDLYQHLSDIYKNRARFTVIFVSRHYAAKLWTRHELKSAQARAFEESEAYILPARFDDTEIPGILPTVGYLDLRQKTPEQVAEAICKKLVLTGSAIAQQHLDPVVTGSTKKSQTEFEVTLCDAQGRPITNASIAVFYPNRTRLEAKTGNDGIAGFQLHQRSLVTLFCAHPEHPAFLRESFDPGENMRIQLPVIDATGSLICPGTGYIPGLSGSLNPIRDTLDRLYLYAPNIAIEGGKQQPVQFAFDQWLHLEDSKGNECQLRIRSILGDAALIEYRFVGRDSR
jgi:hypothetical protein